MRNRFALTLILLVSACGCAQQSETAVWPMDASAEPEIMYGVSASNQRFGAESYFGEWVTQIIRVAPRGRQGPPWAFESGVVLDAGTTELRPKMHLTLAEDGSYTLITNRSPVTNDRAVVFGTWSLSGNRITLTLEGEPTWVFTYRGGKLLTDKDDGTQMVLGRR